MSLISIILLDMGISVVFGIGFLIGAREHQQLKEYNLFALIMFFGVVMFGLEIIDNLNSFIFSRLALLATYTIAGVLFLYAYNIMHNRNKLILRSLILSSGLIIIGIITHFASGGSIRPFYLLNAISLGFYTGCLALGLIKSLKSYGKNRSKLIIYRVILLLPFLGTIYTAFLININLFFGIRLITDVSVIFYIHIFVIVALGISFTLEGASSIINRLNKDSSTDELTQLPNRRYFNTMVDELRSQRRFSEKRHFAALLDLDYFKKINDTFGHDTGDFVLKEIAHYLSLCVRKGDILARYGGEEFVLFFQCADLKEAEALVERIRSKIESLSLTKEDQDINVTLSIGYTEISNQSESMETALRRADGALYDAKEQGRNLCRRG